MKALIKVGYGCNDHCTFCHTLDVRHIDGRDGEVRAKIERAARLGHTMVVLSGGEPTIRPELFAWASHVASLGMDLGLVTNGRLLAYPDAVEKLLAARLRYVYLSLHGGSARVHNSLVRADAWGESYGAIANLAGRGLDVTVNCVVTRQNVGELNEVVDALRPYPDVRLKFSMVQPKGGGAKLSDLLTPRVSDVATAVVNAVQYAAATQQPGAATQQPPVTATQQPPVTAKQHSHAALQQIVHDGIPLCLLPGLEDRYDDLKTHRYASMVEVGEADFFPVDDKDKIQPPACDGCALRGPCPGLYRGYHDAFGAGELRPVVNRARSNSFHWVFEALVPSRDPSRCPLLDDGTTPWDRARHLFVRNAGKVARYRTSTRDFADVELEAIKHAAGQVYLDASRKPALDDFARDLVKLGRSPLCTGCPSRASCTGMFEPILDDVFAQDDALVTALLGGLDGDVLDVGCGDGPYDAVLSSLAMSDKIRYVAVDPDAKRLAALQQRRPWARLVESDAESLATRDDLGRFDHVLVLRSWNHLRDPDAALAALRARMKPGASLLVVDNVAFGLARMPAQAKLAERSPARFEHFRNDDAARADERIARHGFTRAQMREVSPSTSNQWLLRYRL